MISATLLRVALVWVLTLAVAPPTWGGSIFLTRHDPDFHALCCGGNNSLRAQHLNQAALRFILDPAFNSFTAAGIGEFLFVEAAMSPPGGHVDGANGLVASGYLPGVDFETHGASDLNAQLNLLGTKYSAIVIGSDYGGILAQAELNILNARSKDIIAFLNSGGGIFALAESNLGAGLTPQGGHFGYLPFAISSTAFNQGEGGDTLTAFGLSLGLKNADINGNVLHNIFTSTGGLTVVDIDSAGEILTVAGRGAVDPGTGLAPEPISLVLFTAGAMILGLTKLRASRQTSPAAKGIV